MNSVLDDYFILKWYKSANNLLKLIFKFNIMKSIRFYRFSFLLEISYEDIQNFFKFENKTLKKKMNIESNSI